MRKTILILMAMVFLGCATTNKVREYPASHKLAVQPIQQAYNACAPTAVAIVLRYYGEDITPEVIANWVQKGRGTPVEELEWFIASQHYKAHFFRDWRTEKPEIKHFISSGYPVIIGGQYGIRDSTHLTVLSGYDDDKKVFYVAEPGVGATLMVPYRDVHEFHNAKFENMRFYSMVIFPRGSDGVNHSLKGSARGHPLKGTSQEKK